MKLVAATIHYYYSVKILTSILFIYRKETLLISQINYLNLGNVNMHNRAFL